MRVQLTTVVVTVVAVVSVVSVACTPERGESPSEETTSAPIAVPQVTVPPERRTPFCEIMLELDLTVPADPTVDVTEQVLAAYRLALPVAPPEIASELEAVIVGLETGTDPTLPPTSSDPATPSTTTETPPDDTSPIDTSTGDDFAEEGYLPDESPEIRLNEFVDFHCRDNINNPGPPATPPLVEPPPVTPP